MAEPAGDEPAAVPVGAGDTCHLLRDLADEVVCAQTPEPFNAVGLWYERFDPVSDDEVRTLLAAARERERPQRSDRCGRPE